MASTAIRLKVYSAPTMTHTPDSWIDATLAELKARLADPLIADVDLRQVAIELVEDARFRGLSPAEAVAKHLRETA